MKWIKHSLLAVASTAFAVTVGCAQQPAAEQGAEQGAGPGESTEEVVNVYSARHYDSDRTLYDNFTEQTGIDVNLVEGKGDELVERIKSEGENSPADVFITVDAGRLWRAQEAGIMQPIESETLEAAVPEYLRDPEGRWFGLSKRARIIVYNKETVDPSELTTYEALTDPKWQGRIIVRSSNNIYNQSLVGGILAANDPDGTEEWAKGLVDNFARPPEGNDVSQVKAVADGVADLAIVNSYYVARLANSDDPEDRAVIEQLGMFFPNQDDRGTHINISGAGVVANAPNKENAIAFIEYLVTPEVQTQFARNNNEFPVVEGAQLDNAFLEEYVPFKEDNLNAATVGENNAEALQIMDRAGWK
ncbi:Fe(3+) ABC transporter substrate-binding protein [Oscillatoriales cyanobacterium LEGE 11467]|uniref:Fe(3+) ABC transporter substrate-binding protein n=1 Tax=Zarconia navalis LEGE 11467 TaxID=1828826 RepID=A0A928Z7A7_9CYAN|nr:Fe(3+) ABC transporter substrate-binding protein [Zarconia navalis]MBE9041257.1 Fe(3+) ABC transporter substrate-binding protein [Zarconia navalis LEGE 11467]